jgi:hypothetical protein
MRQKAKYPAESKSRNKCLQDGLDSAPNEVIIGEQTMVFKSDL